MFSAVNEGLGLASLDVVLALELVVDITGVSEFVFQ